MVLENNWFWSTFILERQLLNLNDPIFVVVFFIVSLLVCFVLYCLQLFERKCFKIRLFGFCCFFFLSSTQVAGQRDNRANGRDRGEKNFNWYVTSVFKVDSLTRIQTIF